MELAPSSPVRVEDRAARRQLKAFAYEGIWTGSLEGVREVVWPLSVRLV